MQELRDNISKANDVGKITKDGYRVIRINGKLILEHIYVWCSQPENLSYVPRGFVLHHMNEDKLDNNPDNLLLMSRGDHTKFHMELDKDAGINRYRSRCHTKKFKKEGPEKWLKARR